jgi:hypothetical protein
MIMTAPFAIQDLDIDPQNWTPIVAPFSCNNVAVRNPLAVDISICTDPNQPDRDTIAPSAQEGIVAPISGAPYWPHAPQGPYRFPQGATVAYLQTTSGVGTVKIRFVR